MMDIEVPLVVDLIAAQFPEYRELSVSRVEPGGNDNRTFRIGAELSARLPSAAGYVPAVEKEHRWLPELARELAVAIPVPVGLGAPGGGYPWPWSLNRWLPGTDLLHSEDVDRPGLAASLGEFLTALRAIDGTHGPPAGEHSFYRGASLMNYNDETRSVLRTFHETKVWEAAIASDWDGPPTWFHGDLAPGNILIDGGRLSAVIDWGTSGVGDPACDLAIAWTFFDPSERRVFAEEAGLDAGTWSRARGWALWKALITGTAESERVIRQVLDDPVLVG
jgi:aminoglycoside phosphotransferase (APT) family kinase protein